MLSSKLQVPKLKDIEFGGIVAHNTYITGGLGIGRATTTSGALDVSLAGDRITLSSLAGIGSKATTSGQTIGIALEGFDENSSGEWVDATKNPALRGASSESSRSGEDGHALVYSTSIASGQNLSSTTVDNAKPGEGVAPSGQCIPVHIRHYGPGSSPSYQSGDCTVKTGKILVFVNLGYTLDTAVSELGTLNLALSNPSSNNQAPSSFTDIKKMTGYLGKWSIDEEGTLMAVRVITDEMITKKLTVSAVATFGSSDKPIGITLYDPDGAPYCVRVQIGGALASVAGACGSVSLIAGDASAAFSSQPTASGDAGNTGVAGAAAAAPTENPPVPSVPASPETGTSTPSVAELPPSEAATSTPQ